MTEEQKKNLLIRIKNLHAQLGKCSNTKKNDEELLRKKKLEARLQKAEDKITHLKEDPLKSKSKKGLEHEFELRIDAILEVEQEVKQLTKELYANESNELKPFQELINDIQVFDNYLISIASPTAIRANSHGEVKKSATINFRTYMPEGDGILCEKIFGPTKDWECRCGKFNSTRFKGVVCDRCGVEVNHSSIRGERFGHIELAAPIANIWYYNSDFSPICILLNLSSEDLKSVIFFEKYIVIDPGDSDLKKMQILEEYEYLMANEKYGKNFTAGTGSEVIKTLLNDLDLKILSEELHKKTGNTNSKEDETILRRLKVIDEFLKAEINPSWMILDVIPVIPPDLRPVIPIEGGYYLKSVINKYYEKIINRNNRLKKVQAMGAPSILLHSEKRMLQEAVDALLEFYCKQDSEVKKRILGTELSLQDFNSDLQKIILDNMLFRISLRYGIRDYFYKSNFISYDSIDDKKLTAKIYGQYINIIQNIEDTLSKNNTMQPDDNGKMCLLVLTDEEIRLIKDSIENLKQLIEKEDVRLLERSNALLRIARILAKYNIIDSKSFINITEPQIIEASGFIVTGFSEEDGSYYEGFDKCPNCGGFITGSMFNCPKCGIEVNLDINKGYNVCPNCFSEITDDSDCCPNCGKRIYSDDD